MRRVCARFVPACRLLQVGPFQRPSHLNRVRASPLIESPGALGDVRDFSVGADVAAIQWPAGCLGQLKRQLDEFRQVLLKALRSSEVGEIVHGVEHTGDSRS